MRRRPFLGCVGAAAALAACGDDDATPAPEDAGGEPERGRFFDARQWAIVDAATGLIVPTDDEPGAREARAVRYIDTLLSAFDEMPPRIHASGPSSGRRPFPAPDGTPSDDFPENAFQRSIPPSRVAAIAWRIRLEGSAAVPGGDFNDAVLGETRGWRDLYVEGIDALDAAAEARHGAGFAALETAQASDVLQRVSAMKPDFARLLLEHTLEGTFAAPEYGGNEGLVGWAFTRWDGDSMPMGCSFYDAAADRYRDVPDRPTSEPTPGDGPEDFDGAVITTLEIAAAGSGGMRFF